MRILVITRHNPLPGFDGASTYLGGITRALQARGHVIGCAWTERADEWGQGLRVTADMPPGVTELYAPGIHFRGGCGWQFRNWIDARIYSLRMLRRRFIGHALPAYEWSGEGRSWDEPCNAAEQAHIARTIALFEPDILIANFSWMTSGAPAWVAARRPLVVITHDVRHCQLALDETDRLIEEFYGEIREMEAEHLEPAQVVVAIQSREAELLRRIAPHAEVVVVPPVAAASTSPAPVAPEPVVLFVGSAHQANREALQWMVGTVWPLLRAQVPNAVLRVAGAAGEGMTASAGVEILGRVPDLTPVYAGAAVVVAPIRRGAGVKIKVIEAIQHQRAVVATPVAADGLEFVGDALATAATAVDFAAAVVALLKSPGNAAILAQTAGRRMQDAFTPRAAFGPFIAALEGLLSPAPERTPASASVAA